MTRQLLEPPYTDPYVRWCGRGAGAIPPPIPIETCRRQGVQPHVLTLHSDRGSPMRSKTLAQLMADLDVTMSFGRPHVSNDNPYSESLFRTAKYRPGFPTRFTGLPEGESTAAALFSWYNNIHCHSGICYLTPATVHCGDAEPALERRHQTQLAAYRLHPERFVHGPPRRQHLPTAFYINPPTTETTPPGPPSTAKP